MKEMDGGDGCLDAEERGLKPKSENGRGRLCEGEENRGGWERETGGWVLSKVERKIGRSPERGSMAGEEKG